MNSYAVTFINGEQVFVASSHCIGALNKALAVYSAMATPPRDAEASFRTIALVGVIQIDQ